MKIIKATENKIYWFDNFNRYGVIDTGLQLEINDNIEVETFTNIDEWIAYANIKGIKIDKNEYTNLNEEDIMI